MLDLRLDVRAATAFNGDPPSGSDGLFRFHRCQREGSAPRGSRLSGGRVFQSGRLDELGFLKALASHAVEQDLVAIRFPDRGQSGQSRPVQTEVDSAGFTSSRQNPFRQWKRSCLQMIFVA